MNTRRSGHGLVLLPAFGKFLNGHMVKSVSKYPPENTLNATAKYKPIAGALLVSTCAVIALWITLMI